MKNEKEKRRDGEVVDKKTGRKKVAAKPIPSRQGYHGTDSEKRLNPEE